MNGSEFNFILSRAFSRSDGEQARREQSSSNLDELLSELCKLKGFELKAHSQSVEAISEELMKDIKCSTINNEFRRKLNALANIYKYIISDVVTEIEKSSKIRKMVFSWSNGLTKWILSMTTLVSSTLKSLLPFRSNIGRMIGRTSTCKSLLTFGRYLCRIVESPILPFTTQMLSSNKIRISDTKIIREVEYLIRCLLLIHQPGNWLDKDVQNLFPYGIDLELVNEHLLLADGHLVTGWQHYLFILIILSNGRKDESLLQDGAFLMSAKQFVESSVASIWMNRLQMKHFFDKIFNGRGNFLHSAGFYQTFGLRWNVASDTSNYIDVLERIYFLKAWIVNTLCFCIFQEKCGRFNEMKPSTAEPEVAQERFQMMVKKLFGEYD